MTESIFDLLDGVKKEDTSDPNSRVLIIDGLNLYLRVFAVNGMLNDKGVPVGGIMGFLKSLAYSIREVNIIQLEKSCTSKQFSVTCHIYLINKILDTRYSHQLLFLWLH